MKHLDVQLAHRLLRGDLDAATMARWQRHVDRCPRCRELLASERGILTLLSVADEAGPEPGRERGLERFLARLERARPEAVARVQRRRVLLAAGLASCAALLGLLVWQLRANADPVVSAARTLGVPAEVQERVVANLGPLEVLERDPWIVQHYEAVRTLELLVLSLPNP